jgi:hypothetical protein
MAAGGFSGAMSGLIPGVGAGLAAIGGHQMLSRMMPNGAAEVTVNRAMVEVVKGTDKEIDAKVAVMKTALDKMATIPDPRERLRALATYANGAAKKA